MAIQISRPGVWDVTHQMALKMHEEGAFYFDPELSYETSGYRPITETKGLDFDPAPFTAVGRKKDLTGRFTELPIGSKNHIDWWKKQIEYCNEGFEHNGYYVTNDHYFFLNFYTMLSANNMSEESGKGVADSRPSFWAEHYKYFHYIDLCRKLGYDSCLLKSRGVGASETAASLAVRPYITIKNSRSIFTAFDEKKVDLVLGKCWKQLNWLDVNSELAMKKLRQVFNSNKKKRASSLTKDNIETGPMAEIEGMTIDDSDKLRGDRVDNWFLEESGSNKILTETYMVGEALVVINGRRRGNRFVFGTGGCLCAGSNVMTSDGSIINIEDINMKDGIIGHDFTKATIEPIAYMHEVLVKPCVKITTNNGRILECSTDHPIYSSIFRLKAHTKFVEAGKLKVGDKIAVPRDTGIFGNNKIDNAYNLGFEIGNKSNKNIPDSIFKGGCDRESLEQFINGLLDSKCVYTRFKKLKNTTKLIVRFEDTNKDFVVKLNLLLQKLGVLSSIQEIETKNTNGIQVYASVIRDSTSIVNLLSKYDVEEDSIFYEVYNHSLTVNCRIKDLSFDEIVYIESIGYKEVYNLEAKTTNTYIGNGILTHNSKGPDLAGLKALFLDPRAYDILPYRNNMTDSGEYVLTGFFIPAWSTVIDYMDHRGVVEKEKGIAHYMKSRAKLANKPADLIKHCAEYCFTHEEALSREGQNDFNQARLAEQRSEIEHLKRVKPPEKGFLRWTYKGKDSNEIAGVRWEPDPLGDIEIAEHPILDEEGLPVRNLYVGGVDSIDLGGSDSTEGESKFCIVIKKRTFGNSGNKYVCLYLKRPNDVREAYGTAARILWYYGCKANLEDTKIAFRTWLREKRWDTRMLMNRPVFAMTDRSKRNLTLWGTPATTKMITHGIELIRDHIEDYCQNIDYIEMIEQLQRYSFENKGKFDIVAAMGMAEIGDEDMYNLVAREPNEKKTEWHDVGYYFDNKGIRRYGIIPRSSPPNTDVVNELKRQGYKF